MSFFRADDLSISFGGIRALSGLSLSVARGEVFAIIGPNGAGKTTLFNAVPRVLDVESGTISIDGVDITRLPRHQIVHHGIARTCLLYTSDAADE